MSTPTKGQLINVKSILDKYGIVPNHKYGQNFIVERRLINHEIALANINRKGIVLEIGLGIGALTEALASKAKLVVTIEKDCQFESILNDLQKRSHNLEVI